MSIKEETKRASSETPASPEKQAPGNAQSGLAPEGFPESLVPDSPIDDERVLILIDYMHANLHRKISAADFAREVDLSANYISRLFKKETGIPPHEYLIRLRLEKAAHLLLTSLRSIKEIMAITGYGYRGPFGEHFRRYFGPAPSEFRKKFRASRKKRRLAALNKPVEIR